MIKGVIFDFDGTLVDSNRIKRQGFLDVVRSHPGGQARMQAVLARVDGDRAAVFSAYAAAAGSLSQAPGESAAALVQRYGALVDARVAGAPEMAGASRLLDRLGSAGLRLFVSSATPIGNLTAILARRGWRDRFEAVYGHPAEKADSVRAVLRTYGLQPDQLAVVGDGADDRASAAALSCPFFAVGEARGAGADEPVYAHDELGDLLLARREEAAWADRS